MYSQFMISNKVRMILLIVGILIVVGISIVLLVTKKEEPTIIDIKGTIYDIETMLPLANVSIVVGEKRTVSGLDGKFEIKQIPSNSNIEISSAGLYETMVVPVKGRTEIDIYMSSEILSLLRDVKMYEENRQYRKLYELLSEKIKSDMDIDTFLAEKNAWRDDIVANGAYSKFEFFPKYETLKRNSSESVEISVKYIWSGDTDSPEVGDSENQYEITAVLIIEKLGEKWLVRELPL